MLDAVIKHAARLCGVPDADLFRVEGAELRVVAKIGPHPFWSIGEGAPINRDWVTGRAVVDRKLVHVRDLQASDAEFPEGAAYARRYGHRTVLATPLLREGVPIGAILVRGMELRPFTDTQIQLLETFAAQAVIAIENARLFKELDARNRDLTQTIEQQTATGEILRVISPRPRTLSRCSTPSLQRRSTVPGRLRLRLQFRRQAHARGGPSQPARRRRRGPRRQWPMRPDGAASPPAPSWTARGAHRRRPDEPTTRYSPVTGARHPDHAHGSDDPGRAPIGAIAVYDRTWPSAIEQVALVATFADQAVIAIENVRLFTELEARNHD